MTGMMNWFADFYQDMPWLYVFIMASIITHIILVIRFMQLREEAKGRLHSLALSMQSLQERNEELASMVGLMIDRTDELRSELDEVAAGTTRVAGTVRRMGERLKEKGSL